MSHHYPHRKNPMNSWISVALAALFILLVIISRQSQVQADTIETPSCSIKDGWGNEVEIATGREPPPRIDTGTIITVECHMSLEQPREVHTELGSPEWHLGKSGDHNPILVRAGNITTGPLMGDLTIKLTGYVVLPPVSRQKVMGDKSYGYWTDAAQPKSMRIVSIGPPGNIAPDYSVSIIAVHPLDTVARRKVAELASGDGLTSEGRQLANPLIERANRAIDEGRPWLAIELIDYSLPSLKALSPTFWDTARQWIIVPLLIIVFALGCVVWNWVKPRLDSWFGGDSSRRRTSMSTGPIEEDTGESSPVSF